MHYDQLYEQVREDPDLLRTKIAESVRLEENSVMSSILRQAQMVAVWGGATALADRDVKFLKLEAKTLKKNIDDVILPQERIKAEVTLADEGRKATVTAKDDVARATEAYRSAQQVLKTLETQIILAETFRDVLRSTVEAMVHKRDMIQSMNSRQRSEMTAIPMDRWEAPSWSPKETKPDKPKSTDEPSRPSVGQGLGESEADVMKDMTKLARQYRKMKRKK